MIYDLFFIQIKLLFQTMNFSMEILKSKKHEICQIKSGKIKLYPNVGSIHLFQQHRIFYFNEKSYFENLLFILKRAVKTAESALFIGKLLDHVMCETNFNVIIFNRFLCFTMDSRLLFISHKNSCFVFRFNCLTCPMFKIDIDLLTS